MTDIDRAADRLALPAGPTVSTMDTPPESIEHARVDLHRAIADMREFLWRVEEIAYRGKPVKREDLHGLVYQTSIIRERARYLARLQGEEW